MRFWLWATIVVAVTIGVFAVSYSLTRAAPEAPKISHSIVGKEQCLTCHGTQGIKPVPTTHASFDNNSCLSCHTASAGVVAQDTACLSCHGQPSFSMTLANGEKLPLYTDSKIFADSVHGNKLSCTDCHSSISGYPHPGLAVTSRRQYSVVQYETCKRCHFDNYTKTLDSVHYEMFSSGDERAPLCTDCHGAHDVSLPSQPRSKISQTCARCHQTINDAYVKSVHGKALIGENNFDVPVCTDCHFSHTIEDPRTASFRLKSVKICSDCHGNEKLMKKYNISTNVVKSYVQDFHGATVALLEKQGRDIWPKEAVCTDCHGVHDIQQVDSPTSPVIKENLVKTCQRCHTGATANFPSAWLSHYEPSINRASLVFFVRLFYRIMIPFIVVGLALHILLDLWRTITNR